MLQYSYKQNTKTQYKPAEYIRLVESGVGSYTPPNTPNPYRSQSEKRNPRACHVYVDHGARRRRDSMTDNVSETQEPDRACLVFSNDCDAYPVELPGIFCPQDELGKREGRRSLRQTMLISGPYEKHPKKSDVPSHDNRQRANPNNSNKNTSQSNASTGQVRTPKRKLSGAAIFYSRVVAQQKYSAKHNIKQGKTNQKKCMLRIATVSAQHPIPYFSQLLIILSVGFIFYVIQFGQNPYSTEGHSLAPKQAPRHVPKGTYKLRHVMDPLRPLHRIQPCGLLGVVSKET